MKILFVQKEGGIFGAENYQLKIIPGLLRKGIEIEFLRLYTNYQGGVNGDFVELLESMGVKIYQINIGKYPTLSVLREIHRTVKLGKYDLVHTHLIHADFHLALSKKIFTGKYTLVSTKHGYDNAFTSKFGFDASKQTKTAYFMISKWAEKSMKASFTISKGLRDFFIETGLTRNTKMSLIYYGFTMPDNYANKSNDNFKLAEKQIIIAGRLVKFKGHTFILQAMPEVIKKYGDKVKLIIAGTGDEEDNLRKEAKDLKIESQVEFLGYSKKVGSYMANSDIVVIPSVSEGFGVVFLEAFSAKTPVVCWDVPAGNELIEDGVSGHLVKPYNIEKLSMKLIEILDEPDSGVVENAYLNLNSKFTVERMLNETIYFYESNLSS